MTTAQVFSLVLAMAAIGAYFNHRWLRWPPVLGLTGVAILVSVGLQVAGQLGLVDTDHIAAAIEHMDFEVLLLDWLLAILLFGGSLFVDASNLKRWAGPISMLAGVGVIVSTFVVGGLVWVGAQAIGTPLPMIWCCVFGALISPTDPIAAIAIVRKACPEEAIEHQLVGESLFNDGTGVVLFLALLGVLHGHDATALDISRELILGPLGGAVVGGGLAWLMLRAMRGIDHAPTEILMTLALAMGSYTLAGWLHVSGPIAAVAAGLLVGTRGRQDVMSEHSRHRLDIFWGALEELLNGALFVLIGLEILVLEVSPWLVVAGVGAWLLVLLARFVAVGASLAPFYRRLVPGTWGVLAWGGLRGGISLALALSLPADPAKEVVVALTFVVVVLSAVGQGSTLGWICRRSIRHSRATTPAPRPPKPAFDDTAV